ncbi:MAG: DedA family protein [Candidatus Paceibacterota bacterium]|jgi:membrane protein DedA with SNARE-associated domain
MDFFLQTIIPYLLLYKYTTIFIIAFGAALIIPIPSGSILMATSAFASIGYFNIYWVIILSIIANILGDNMGYWIARSYGKEVLSRVGFRKILESKTLKMIEDKFNKHPGFIIFASRFEVLSTLSVNLLSGISKTPYKKYFIYESIGSVAQVCMYSLLGYFFADRWETVNTTVGRISLILVLVLALVIISFGHKKIIKKLK